MIGMNAVWTLTHRDKPKNLQVLRLAIKRRTPLQLNHLKSETIATAISFASSMDSGRSPGSSQSALAAMAAENAVIANVKFAKGLVGGIICGIPLTRGRNQGSGLHLNLPISQNF